MELLYPLSKSHMAFTFAVERMFEYWPKSVYMWTFTFKKAISDERAMQYWAGFMKHLHEHHCDCKGIRVVEVHPGNNFWSLSHGLHFHALFNKRVSVHWIRRYAARWDFGKVHVRRVTQSEALYIGKYLTKDQPTLKKGMRRWGSVNWPECNRKNDCGLDSQFHRNIEIVQRAAKLNQMTADVVHTIFVNTKYHGEYKNWPVETFYYGQFAKKFLSDTEWGIHRTQKEWDAERGKMLPHGNNQ